MSLSAKSIAMEHGYRVKLCVRNKGKGYRSEALKPAVYVHIKQSRSMFHGAHGRTICL